MEVNQQEKSKVKNWPIVLLLVLMYIVVAMSDNFKGIFVPFFKGEFKVDNTEIGYVLTASLFAYAVFQYIGGILIEKYGYKKIIASGFIIAIVALLTLINCPSFPVLIIGMFLLNTGMAMFNIGVNTLGPVLTVASTAVLMNFINFSYGAGNTAIQKISGNLLASGIPWRKFYIFMIIAVILLFIYLLVIKIPYKPKAAIVNWSKKDLFSNKMLYLYIGICGLYLAAEYGIGNWFVNYMNESFGFTADKSAFYVALFFGCETIGRLFGGFIVDKLGHFRSILIYGVIATLMSFAGIIMGEKGLLIFGLAGFAYSIIFPTIITTIGRVFKEATSYATGLILMCGTLIAMLASMGIGLLNDIIGAQQAFYVIAIVVALTTACAQIINKRISKEND
ncbi:MFS transporter [Clostridium tyrobutyricum]|uniref:MFS transporter n=1 Tax=Clostridium tyrobutyricum TaxID=1519 RepID=UPI001C3878B8|nr:MFS transporter [Clostridium tyrobutyricum]MBV4418860.1 MFS transporter [Clostridium tyrobutyricum]